ncbi:MAG: asparagine synthase-related protein [Candidatus Methanoperedens sp.]|nr:asparagine synthase-related protein [Candidatus Methanoperedens sp.]
MCGIAGAVGKDARSLVMNMLSVLEHRGPDESGTFSDGDITIGNVMLKITGNKSQPISNGKALTYNGEIFNFREIAKELDIDTDSDSETLFNLIRTKGLEEAIQELDGDYAFAYYEKGKITLVRDPVGVKPLYYTKGDVFAFASEKKALFSIGKNEINVLRPGHMMTYEAGSITEKKVTSFSKGKPLTDENIASEMLFKSLETSIRKRFHKPCAIAFSGGLDSSFLAAMCKDAKLYSVGMAGSHDIRQTRNAARQLGLLDNLNLREITLEELGYAIPQVINAIESTDPLMVSIALPLYFASKYASNDGLRVIMSGQGADELFGGYKRYDSLGFEDLEKALRTDLDNIAKNNLERDDAVTMVNSVELRVPYLDKKVIELALSISPELKIHNGIRKYILRLAASYILPDELTWKEKKAAQYSSGIYSAMEKIARKNGYGKDLRKYLEEKELSWGNNRGALPEGQ